MAQEDELQPKKKSKLKWIILIFLVLLLGGGAFGAYQFGLLDRFLKDGQEETEGQNQSQQAALDPQLRQAAERTATLDPFLVNLSDPLGRRYIKLTIAVEVVAPEVIKELEMQKPRIRDRVITLLTSKTFEDLASEEGKLLLKNEVLDRINQVLGSPKVSMVFFTDLVIQ